MAALAALACVLVPTGTAQASTSQESMVEDDGVLLYSGDAAREKGLDMLDSLGTDTVHALVVWERIAPNPSSRHKPHFDASNPAAYPPGAWDPYDSLVRGATKRGLRVLLTPTGMIPSWASHCHGSHHWRRACRPDAGDFGDFVTALAKRYSGSYHDENQGGGVLPRVSRWSVWNEPNQGGWLRPQFSRYRHRIVPEAAYRYRQLFYAARKAFDRTGHHHDQILLGETAPLGRTRGRLSTRPIAPARFYRAVFCLNGRGHKHRGRSARHYRGCSHFRALHASGVAHHPYTDGAARWPHAHAKRDWITINTLGRLEHVLNQAAHYRRIRRGAPIYLTEYGFQTNPPDRTLGMSWRRQAAYLNESNWMAYRRGRVRSIAQYELVDDSAVGAFNTGLLTASWHHKTSYAAYRMPLWVETHRGRIRVFGQVRPAHRGEVVRIQFRARHGHYHTLSRARVNSRGYFTRRFRMRHGYWRLSFTPSDHRFKTIHSRTAKAARR